VVLYFYTLLQFCTLVRLILLVLSCFVCGVLIAVPKPIAPVHCSRSRLEAGASLYFGVCSLLSIAIED
jgi:hypothetical protein